MMLVIAGSNLMLSERVLWYSAKFDVSGVTVLANLPSVFVRNELVKRPFGPRGLKLNSCS